MTHSELKELQTLQLNILKHIDDICRQHNIQYYIMYGTLLGAVRHKGTIPWDYDIDIAMPREDHDRFVKIVKENPEGYDIWHVCYSSIKTAGLTRVTKYDEKYKYVCVDIFILDYARVHGPVMQKLVRQATPFLRIAKQNKSEKAILKEQFRGQKAKLLILFLARLFNGLMGGSANVEKLSFRLRVSPKATDTFVVGDSALCFPISTFTPHAEMPYEQYTFMAPNEYKSLLTAWYNDYMQYPKEGLKWLEEEKQARSGS